MLTKEEAVQEMVEWHYKIDPNMKEVIRFLSPHEEDPAEPMNFLEVSPDTLPSGDVMTFLFGPYEDFPYSMRIATVTPEEMEQVRRREIPLPGWWDLESSIVYPASDYKGQEGRRWHRSRGIVRSPVVRSNGRKPFRAYRMRSEVN